MLYYSNYYGGMNLIWWFAWIILLVWIFATPYNIPFQRMKKESPFDVLKKRLAMGLITSEEYKEKKRILENDLAK